MLRHYYKILELRKQMKNTSEISRLVFLVSFVFTALLVGTPAYAQDKTAEIERIGRTNCVIATAFVGNAPPHAIPLVSDNGQYVNFDGLCLVKRHFTAEACRWLRNFCTPEPYCSLRR